MYLQWLLIEATASATYLYTTQSQLRATGHLKMEFSVGDNNRAEKNNTRKKTLLRPEQYSIAYIARQGCYMVSKHDEWGAIKLDARRELLFVYNPLCTLELVVHRKMQGDTAPPASDCSDRPIELFPTTVDRAQTILPHSIESTLLLLGAVSPVNNNNSCFDLLMHANSSRNLR